MQTLPFFTNLATNCSAWFLNANALKLTNRNRPVSLCRQEAHHFQSVNQLTQWHLIWETPTPRDNYVCVSVFSRPNWCYNELMQSVNGSYSFIKSSSKCHGVPWGHGVICSPQASYHARPSKHSSQKDRFFTASLHQWAEISWIECFKPS